MEEMPRLNLQLSEEERKHWDQLFSDVGCLACHNAPPRARRHLEPDEYVYPRDIELCPVCGKFYIYDKDKKTLRKILIPFSEESWFKVWPIQ